jgi:cytochrome c1
VGDGREARWPPAAPTSGWSPRPINRLDLASQQRGARIFVNYCLNCHTAKYMRYNRLTDLGLTEAQIRDNLMFATDKIGETMNIAMRPADAKAWFGWHRRTSPSKHACAAPSGSTTIFSPSTRTTPLRPGG